VDDVAYVEEKQKRLRRNELAASITGTPQPIGSINLHKRCSKTPVKTVELGVLPSENRWEDACFWLVERSIFAIIYFHPVNL